MLSSSSVWSDRTPQHVRTVSRLAPAIYSARLATNDQTYQHAYRLRYESYLASGFIDADQSALFRDKYDDLPNCQTLIIYDDGVPLASVRTCLLTAGSGLRSPASDTYPGEVGRLLDECSGFAPGRGIETTRLVRRPSAENNQGLVFLLYRLAGYIGVKSETQVLFACVRSNHAPFYKRLGYTPVTEPRPYPNLKCPMQLMACTRQSYDRVCQMFPIIDPQADSSHDLDGLLAGEEVSLRLVRP